MIGNRLAPSLKEQLLKILSVVPQQRPEVQMIALVSRRRNDALSLQIAQTRLLFVASEPRFCLTRNFFVFCFFIVDQTFR